MTANKVPCLSTWAGGEQAFLALTERFYDKVMKDDLLEPVFRHMDAEHARHVALFLNESFGGERKFTALFGDQAMQHVVGKHLEKYLTEAHRKRWMQLILESGEELGMPQDPEFMGVLVGHLEWGTRFAVLMSHEKDNPMTTADHVPDWDWGTFGGPFGHADNLFQRPRPAINTPNSAS